MLNCNTCRSTKKIKLGPYIMIPSNQDKQILSQSYKLMYILPSLIISHVMNQPIVLAFKLDFSKNCFYFQYRHCFKMSAGSSTQSAFIQGNQSTREHDVPHNAQHSALFYLFQEVSKLASPIQSTFLDTNSPSTWLKENSRQGPFMVKKEEEDAYSFEISTTSCQAGLHHMVPYNQIKNVREKSHSSKATTLTVGNSPWKVLSLINLQCEKLLHHSDAEQSDKAITATPYGTDQEVGGECVSVEFTFRPSQEEHCLKDSEMSCCIQSQAAEDTVEPDMVEEKQNALFQTIHPPNSSLNNQLTYNSSVNASIPLLKPEQTLDCSANPLFNTQPLSSILHSSESLSTVFNIDEGHSLPKHGDGIAAVQLEGTHTPIEQNNPPAEQCRSSSCNVETNPPSYAVSKPESRPVQNEESAPSATLQRRNKTCRKQPHPSRSVDIQDPDFQGVTFRMDTELDDSREQCRLLITSKYRYDSLITFF